MRLRWIALEKKIERRVKVKTRDAITRKREREASQSTALGVEMDLTHLERENDRGPEL